MGVATLPSVQQRQNQPDDQHHRGADHHDRQRQAEHGRQPADKIAAELTETLHSSDCTTVVGPRLSQIAHPRASVLG